MGQKNIQSDNGLKFLKTDFKTSMIEPKEAQ